MSRVSVLLALVLGLVNVQSVIPLDLAAMADTERAFAKAATVKGWRDAFLEFFADDAITVAAGVTPAKDGLRKQASTPFSELELVWEPRLGDVAASGDLGWLTGPSTSTNHARDNTPRHGCYLSIWRKQPDGTWRVFIDVGTGAPAPVPFAAGFTRAAFADRYSGTDGMQLSGQRLAEADRELNAQMAALGATRAVAARITPASRLHRPGVVPITGTEAIAAWLTAHATTVVAKHGAAESAAAGDFGYTYGTFEIAAPKPLSGAYVRLWTRDAAGRWWLTVDVAQPIR